MTANALLEENAPNVMFLVDMTVDAIQLFI
jgi:hypothetical protein